MDKKTFQHCLVSLLFLTALIRILAAVYWQIDLRESGREFAFGDSVSYWTISQVFNETGELAYGVGGSKMFRAPLYPLLLSPIHGFADGQLAVLIARLLGVGLSVLLVWALVQLTNQLAGPVAGLIAGVFYCCYPGAIGMSIFVLSESLFCPLMVISLWFIQIALARESGISNTHDWSGFGAIRDTTISADSNPGDLKKPEAARVDRSAVWPFWLFAGIASGMGCLSRPSWLLWSGCLALLLIVTKYGLAKTVGRLVVFHVGLALAMSPWWVRNYQVCEKFVPTTLQVGASLYDSFHEESDGSSNANMAFMEEFEKRQRREDAKTGGDLESTFEWRLDQLARNEAWARIVENPSAVVRLGLLKFARTWSPFPLGKTVQNVWVARSEALGYLCITIFAAAAFVVWRSLIRNGTETMPWVGVRFLCLWSLPAMYFAVLHSLFVGSIRYRHPPMVAMTVVAGIGCVCVGRMVRKFVQQNRKPPQSDETGAA